jgi:hypothetical protein
MPAEHGGMGQFERDGQPSPTEHNIKPASILGGLQRRPRRSLQLTLR